MIKDNIIQEIVSNASKLIHMKTIKNNFIEFDKAFEFIKTQLTDYFIKEIIVNNYKNLVISNFDGNDFDVIFCAHIDVVPSDKYESYISDGRLYGRGSFDMKSQLSVIISLLKHNNSSKKIAFLITSDEEIGGMCCKEIMKNFNSKLAVIPDAGKNFELITEEKGLLQLEIVTKGIKAHSSEPFNGQNAILKAFDIYNKILSLYKMPMSEIEYKTSINLSKIEGGVANNAVPDECKMILDIRFTNSTNKDIILNDIKNIAEDSIINILDYGPVFFCNPQLKIIKNFINDCSMILNKKLVINKCLATSDAIYFSEKNIPTILINPIGNYWHSPKEYVEIDSLYKLYCIFKTLL